MMDTGIFKIAAKLAAWITGSAEQAERREVEIWKNENPEHERLFEKLTSDMDFQENREKLERFPVAGAWKKMEKRLGNPSPGSSWRIWGWKYAAILILCMGTGILYWNVKRPGEMRVTVMSSGIQAGTQGARLTLGDGRVVEIIPGKTFTVTEADGTLIQKDSAGIDYRRTDTVAGEEVWNRMETLTGMEYSLVLADGTHVYLNAETKLKFPVAFRGEQRVVELTGEAYFRVAKDTLHPFVVRMKGASVEVLGTSFNARAYGNEPSVVTTLVEGQVKMNGRRIAPGEQAEYVRESGELTVREVDVNRFIAWQTGRFVFRNERLEDVMRTLARWYGVEYHFLDTAAKEIRIGASFGRYDNMEPIMKMLEQTGLVDVLLTDRSIYISAKK